MITQAFFRVTIRLKNRRRILGLAHWSFPTLSACRHLGFLATFIVRPIFLGQSVHDTTIHYFISLLILTINFITILEQVTAMGPLIDAALEKVDRRHAQLTQLSSDLVDALNLYHTLMREPPPPTPSNYTLPKMPPHINPYQFQNQGPPPPHVRI